MNADVLLALIGDLYAQIIGLQQQLAAAGERERELIAALQDKSSVDAESAK